MPHDPDRNAQGPKKPRRPPSYSEGANESPKLVEAEPTDVERETPETENEPVERDATGEAESPIFEE